MIVRIMGEGQFRLPEDATARLNEIDAELEADLQDDGEADLARHLASMHQVVFDLGHPLGAEELEPSDFILPPATISLAELRALLSEEGLIPG